MRIAVLTNAYPPKAQGGAGRIAFEYTNILKSLGHEVKVWVPSEGFSSLGTMTPLARLFFHFRDLGPWKEIVKEITEWNPEVLLTHNLTGCGFRTPRWIRATGVRWIHVLHDVQLFEPSGQIVSGESFQAARKVWRGVWGWLRKRNLGQPDIVISPTKWLMEQHEAHGFFKKSKKVVVPNPVPSLVRHFDQRGEISGAGDLSTSLEMTIKNSVISTEAQRSGEISETRDLSTALEMTKGEEGMTRNEKQILFVGRLDRDKGIDLLLEAWPELKKFSDKLVVVGGGLRLEDFQKQFPEVEFKGQLSSEEVLKTMAQSGVLVVPSLVMENQPTVILEGLACGCMVVASDVGGVKETLGEAGQIFKPGSVDNLVEVVKEIFEDSSDRSSAIEKVLKLHDPGTVAGVLAGLLKSNL
ncbi:MAG: glycosyltransferase family 4 protein [Patescibacteria group bacterium]